MQREKAMTVGTWAEQWFTQRVGQWSPNTEGGYRNLIYSHIVPGIGRAGLTDLTTRRIQSFYKRLVQNGLSTRSVWCVHLLLRRCLDEACREGQIPLNPAKLCAVPQVEDKTAIPLRLGQLQRYLSASEKLGALPLIYIGLTSGLRQCELLTLSWADFHVPCRCILKGKRLLVLNDKATALLADLPPSELPEYTALWGGPDFQDAVEDIKERIRAGEAFQVVPSQRFETPCTASALDVYRVLRATNPSPYMYLLRLDGFDVVGSSPEALVKVEDGRAMVHPIAGTRHRGATPQEDQALAEELLADPKERAEHLMLVDLGRNDLGRVCAPGSVEVVDFMSVERYSHVMHIVSTVTGRVAEDRSAFDVLTACFPAGTLSGAPKPRALQIIEELEPTRRGLYGGCVGYLDFAGDSDTAIAIRTALLRDGTAYVQAGAGVVADSDPAAEDTECRNKAAAVLRAVHTANRLRSGSGGEG